ncbi:hypothetical protein SESBI_06848 [Sesbania bispinosa]|nr:hypothetical protein SESBI_06848 [Sesbania bispinosa]
MGIIKLRASQSTQAIIAVVVSCSRWKLRAHGGDRDAGDGFQRRRDGQTMCAARGREKARR